MSRLRETATPHGSFLWIVNNIYFQYYSVLICLVSHGGDGRRELCHGSRRRSSRSRGPDLRHRDRRAAAANRGAVGAWGDVVTSALVLAAIAAAYLYFTG